MVLAEPENERKIQKESKFVKVRLEYKNSKTLKILREIQKLPRVKIGSWIRVGSGNYEKYPLDGRYRITCGTIKHVTACKNHPTELKLVHYQCNKLDCEICYVRTASERARKINIKFTQFKKIVQKSGIKLGNPIHISLTLRSELGKPFLDNYELQYLKLRKVVSTILKNSGLKDFTLFFQHEAVRCKSCGKRCNECLCRTRKLERVLNIHFHAIGFGYIISTYEFRKRYPDWIIRNHGSREDVYQTAFYILTNSSLWRKRDGNLKKVCQSYGHLHPRKLRVITKTIKYTYEKCPHCKESHYKVKQGVILNGDTPKPTINMLVEQREMLSRLVLHNKNLNIYIDKKKQEFGNVHRYKIIIPIFGAT